MDIFHKYVPNGSVNKLRTRNVLKFLEETMRVHKIINPPKSSIMPGCRHCKQLYSRRSVRKRYNSLRGQPIFVTKLHRSIDVELKKIRARKCSANCVDLVCKQKFLDARLKVYRAAFNVLLDKITTFKPLLSSIKCTFEESLNVRDDRITLMETVRENLNEFKRSVECKVEEIRQRGLKEIYKLEEHKRTLSEEVAGLKSVISERDARIEALKQELLDLYEGRTPEIGNTRLKVSSRQRNRKMSSQQVEDHGEEIQDRTTKSETNSPRKQIEDVVLLRVCLERSRKDLSIAHRRIMELEETFRDVVPKRELEKLDNLHQILKKERDDFAIELKSLAKEYSSLKAAFEKLKEQKNSLRDRCKLLAHTNTPRPDWSKCGQFVQDGVQRWRDITAKKSSEERLTILLSELCGAANAENDYLIGQGTDQSVPTFLRYKGKVKNRKLGRREVSILINDLWKNKCLNDVGTPMGDYILKYFTERYHLPLMRYEWIYNLYNACQRLVYDEQIGLFWGVLWGNVVEDAYHVPRKEFHAMRKMMEMRMEDKKINALLAEDIMDVVDTMYPHKTNQDIENIVYAAAKQLGIDPSTEAFDIAKLFAPNEEGWERGEFARELARQTTQEIKDFAKSILTIDGVHDKNTLAGVELLKKRFLEVDEGIYYSRGILMLIFTAETLLAHRLKWIFKVQDLSKAKPITSGAIVKQMISGYMRRTRPKKNAKDGMGTPISK